MDNNTNSTTSSDETLQEVDPQKPATGTPVTGETPETTTPPTLEELLKERDDLKAALKKTNAESAAHRRKAKELDDLKEQIEAEKLSETEKLQKKNADLQSRYDATLTQFKERTASYEVQLKAAQMNIVDPEVAVQLIKNQIEYDDNGDPTNIDDLLKELVKTKPYLTGRSGVIQSSGGATNPSRLQSGANEPITWESIGRMTAQDYARRSTEVQQFMAAHPRR